MDNTFGLHLFFIFLVCLFHSIFFFVFSVLPLYDEYKKILIAKRSDKFLARYKQFELDHNCFNL